MDVDHFFVQNLRFEQIFHTLHFQLRIVFPLFVKNRLLKLKRAAPIFLHPLRPSIEPCLDRPCGLLRNMLEPAFLIFFTRENPIPFFLGVEFSIFLYCSMIFSSSFSFWRRRLFMRSLYSRSSSW